MSGLQLSEAVLQSLGIKAGKAEIITRAFQKHDNKILEQQLAVLREKGPADQTLEDSVAELKSLLHEDKKA